MSRSIKRIIEHSNNAVSIRDNKIKIEKNKHCPMDEKKFMNSLENLVVGLDVTVIDYDNKEIQYSYMSDKYLNDDIVNAVRDGWIVNNELKYTYRWYTRILSCYKKGENSNNDN